MANLIDLFLNSKIFHLPNYTSDHLPIMLRTEPCSKKKVRQFRVEQWWSAQGDFGKLCTRTACDQIQSWEDLCVAFKKEVKVWECGGKDPNLEIANIEKEMARLLTWHNQIR